MVDNSKYNFKMSEIDKVKIEQIYLQTNFGTKYLTRMFGLASKSTVTLMLKGRGIKIKPKKKLISKEDVTLAEEILCEKIPPEFFKDVNAGWFRRKVSDEDRKKIVELYTTTNLGCVYISRLFNVFYQTIRKILKAENVLTNKPIQRKISQQDIITAEKIIGYELPFNLYFSKCDDSIRKKNEEQQYLYLKK
jgi:hypothetical protein